ncbi:hypothetical protein QEN58_14855 [Halomonas alkaliantarctica]|uniref:FlxA-like protein n=1 Tax=Halomonas alkaliantarctica TaxID=232346 RepID=A0ABY8LMR7_9GAMM|nr:hypothetical protein [Halomonas alkaliantarctica]WGI24602.1 hypothetical protein QEN58_14855 [Halomonas alkaliantarctica]
MTISLPTGIAPLDAHPLRSEPSNAQQVTTTSVTSNAATTDSNTSIHLDLSPVARGIASASEKAGNTQEAKNTKIDESDLPQEIKELLKRVAEYREKLREKEQELEEVMRDQSLNDEQRQAKLDALQQEISSLNNSLQEAMSQLSKLVTQMDIDDGAVVGMMSLAMS